MVEFPKSVASQIPDVDAPIVPVLKCYLWKPLGGGGRISWKDESDECCRDYFVYNTLLVLCFARRWE